MELALQVIVISIIKENKYFDATKFSLKELLCMMYCVHGTDPCSVIWRLTEANKSEILCMQFG